MGKPTICIGENKGADQLRGNREADNTIPLLSKPLLIFCDCTAQLMSDLFGNHIVGFPKRWLICFLFGVCWDSKYNFMRKFPNRSNTNRAVQPQQMAGDWKFWI